jgi:hypothetical protein
MLGTSDGIPAHRRYDYGMITRTNFRATIVPAMGLCGLLLMGVALSGCEQSPPPPMPTREEPQTALGKSAKMGRDIAGSIEGASQQAAAPAAALGAGTTIDVQGLVFPIPAGWQRTNPASPMRVAQFAVNTDATMYFTQFPAGQGGDVASNINRWAGMVRDPSTNEPAKFASTPRALANGVRLTMFDSSGTFIEGMPGQTGTPRPNFRFVGAIFEAPGGGRVFARMTGPDTTIEAALNDWNALINGATIK